MNDRQITKSRNAIKLAFLDLLSEKDLEQITIQDISDRANIGRRTFYYHYQDKYDLLSSVLQEHIDELHHICKDSSKNNEYMTAEYSLGWFDYFEKNHQFFSTMLAGKGTTYFRSHFLSFVMDELQASIQLTSDKNNGIDAEIYFRFFGNAIVGIIEAYFAGDIKMSAKEMARQVDILFSRNIY